VSRRPNRQEIARLKKQRRQAQKELRARQRAQGLEVPSKPTPANRVSEYDSVEQEQGARFDAVAEQVRVYRDQLPVLLERLAKIPEPRNPQKVKHRATVLLIYGILTFAFHMASRRQANEEMTRPMFMANLQALFPELEELPHHDTLQRFLAQIDVSQIEQAHLDLMRSWSRNKKFRRYLIGNCYPIAVDGTEKFARWELWAEQCMEQQVGEAQRYSVYTVEANLAFRNGMVIPLLTEFLDYTAGDQARDKQDCEARGFKRLAQRLKEYFPHLPIMVLLDGLYPNGPIITLCRQYKWDFMMVLPEGSLPSVWEEFYGLQELEPPESRKHNWGDRRQHFQWVNDIEYWYRPPGARRDKKELLHVVVCEESWEQITAGGSDPVQKQAFHAWISGKPLNRHNVHERCNHGARHRWGIEQGFLTEKHHGYRYEHCFSYDWNAMRGYHYLMRLAHALLVLAQYSTALIDMVRRLGVQGFIRFVRQTLAGPWLDREQLQQRISAPFQLRLI
jgi:hypothetical protein